MVVVLDNIRSMFNTGSIFRTADALGAEKIYLCGLTPSPLDKLGRIRPKFVKTSLGSEGSVPFEKRVSTARVLDKLKKEGYKILAIEQHPNSTPYYSLLPTSYSLNKIALVMGHEVRGLSEIVLERADKILEIPMAGMKESLNVAIAFSIVAYELKYGKK
ncbi:MAG: TrmH family RNA methyltransferase [Candidatus Colwellbacteria bacterium]|nr:TrmH family RNA methyltransferase [Candidatus Colwellbacteria bacterium]